MKTKTRFLSSVMSLIAMAALLMTCASPTTIHTKGTIRINIGNNINARTLVPSIDMNASSYTITGTGPSGATFSQTVSGTSATFGWLVFGTWTITINALNATGTIIGSGQATVTVTTGETTSVTISVVPLAGNGTLSLAVNWTASQVQIPSMQASLTGPTGSPTSLAFAVSGNQGTYSSSTIPAGYQTLVVQLLDNGIPVMGAVEVVRIVAGQTTTGTYTFANVNQPGGTIAVNISPELAEPIPVSIAGVASTVTAGSSITATASVSDGTANVVYVWYLNGVSKATGSSYTFGSGLAAGYYRLDVTAFTTDGKRAGSSSVEFQAGSSVLPPGGAGVAQWARTVISGIQGSKFSGVTTGISGSIYAVGSIEGTGIYDFGYGQTVAGTSDYQNSVIVKYDDSGVVLWAKSVSSGIGNSFFLGVSGDALGNSYSVGEIEGTGTYNFGNGQTATGASVGPNSVIVKYDGLGVVQWTKTVSSDAGASSFRAVTVDALGNSYAVGKIYGTGDFDFGDNVMIAGSYANQNTVIVKYNSAGVAQWARTVSAGSSNSYFTGVASDASGNSYAVGQIFGTGTYDFGNSVTATGPSEAGNPVIVQYNSMGVSQWAKTIGSGSPGASFNGVACEASGNNSVVGSINGPGVYDFGNGQITQGPGAVIVKYSSTGVTQWVKAPVGTIEFLGVASDALANNYVVGAIGLSGTFDFGNGHTVQHGGRFIVKYNSGGDAQWVKTENFVPDTSFFRGVTCDALGNIHAVGYFAGTGIFRFGNGQTLTAPYDGYNAVIVKYN